MLTGSQLMLISRPECQLSICTGLSQVSSDRVEKANKRLAVSFYSVCQLSIEDQPTHLPKANFLPPAFSQDSLSQLLLTWILGRRRC